MIFTRIAKRKKLGLSSTVKKGAGFTLIELMVVMAILGTLAAIGLTTFRNSQIKSRDAKRKSDLEQVQRALEMYYNDYGGYPLSSVPAGGTIDNFSWGSEMKDIKETVYMKELPKNPTGNPEYCYISTGTSYGTFYKLYAKLENTQDPKCLGGDCATARACGPGTYNYGVASPNATP